MNKLVEAAAKAIDPGAWASDHPENYYRQELARKMARTALRAMAECEPTRSIHEAFWNVVGPRDSWRALLLAAAEDE